MEVVVGRESEPLANLSNRVIEDEMSQAVFFLAAGNLFSQATEYPCQMGQVGAACFPQRHTLKNDINVRHKR